MAAGLDTPAKMVAGRVVARDLVQAIPASHIRATVTSAADIEDVIALWYGESDFSTPDVVCQAAAASLARGETFYTENLGLQELRTALADYMSRLYACTIAEDRIAVTASGMSALNLLQQVLVDPGDNVVVIGPVWPNILEAIHTMGGETRSVNVHFGQTRWELDFDQVLASVDDKTKAIFVNSPNNPTGWVMRRDAQRTLLDFCRRRGIWIIADEVYARIIYDQAVAPSFLELIDADDQVIVVNSFSKSWAMTGWRLGWITAPPALLPQLEKMIEFHYSCPVHFAQIGALTALRQGEDFVQESVARYRQARDLTVDHMRAVPQVSIHAPEGAFYAFFKLDGLQNSLGYCKNLARTAKVGLAPGSAFGAGGEGFLRLCFASSLDRLQTALVRLQDVFQQSQR